MSISVQRSRSDVTLGLTWRSLSYHDGPIFKKHFTAFVRPHFEYSQVIWAQYFKKHISTLENVQSHVAKPVNRYKLLNYTERLKRLGHLPLI